MMNQNQDKRKIRPILRVAAGFIAVLTSLGLLTEIFLSNEPSILVISGLVINLIVFGYAAICGVGFSITTN